MNALQGSGSNGNPLSLGCWIKIFYGGPRQIIPTVIKFSSRYGGDALGLKIVGSLSLFNVSSILIVYRPGFFIGATSAIRSDRRPIYISFTDMFQITDSSRFFRRHRGTGRKSLMFCFKMSSCFQRDAWSGYLQRLFESIYCSSVNVVNVSHISLFYLYLFMVNLVKLN